MQLSDRGNEVEPQPEARRITHLLRAIKPPQYRVALLIVDAWSRIRDAHDGLAIAAQKRQPHLSFPGCELDGIVDEIGDRLEQQIAIATHAELALRRNTQLNSLVFGNRLV